MCLKPGGDYEPYLDAMKCFDSGYVLIRAYKNKYGYSYRETIKKALLEKHNESEIEKACKD